MLRILDFFRSAKQPPATAGTAKERLQIILAHERSDRKRAEFLPQMQRDILAVVRKYVRIDDEHLKLAMRDDSGTAILEINVELPAKPA
ncbi:MAG: cell division topological specificity factor MinE [Geminicoccaceae bacterium]